MPSKSEMSSGAPNIYRCSIVLPGTRKFAFCLSLLQVSGVGYNGEGNVHLLPSKEILKEFSNVSVGKLVEVSINYELACAIYIQFSFAQITVGN